MGTELIKNIIAVLFLALGLIVILYLRLKTKDKEKETDKGDIYAIKTMVDAVKQYINGITGEIVRITGEEDRKRELERAELGKAVRNCGNGNMGAKAYVKEQIKKWLLEIWLSNRAELDRILAFDRPEAMSAADKFEILLYDYAREYKSKAAARLLDDLLDIHAGKSTQILYFKKENGSGEEGSFMPHGENVTHVIDSFDVNELYAVKTPYLDSEAKADIITNLIYRQYKGHGVIDTLRDMEIDGISAGVSGKVGRDRAFAKESVNEWDEQGRSSREGLMNYESIWVFSHGNMIRLSFLSFGCEAELERVCKNIYRFNNPGQLSATKGFIANDMSDGSRVIVVRPPFSESWAFFVRKFGKKGTMPVERIINGPGAGEVRKLLKHIISGCQVFGITGEQGCGKTTLLKALIEFIPANYTLRIQELLFELHLREEYPERNIVTFRETPEITGREALDLQKKTDGMVNIIGEVASAPVAGWLVMVSQVASRFTIFTHHAKTTDDLITSLRNDLMSASGFNNEYIAENQVRQAVRFDVHMVRLPDGTRHISRITEIAADPKDANGNRLIMEMTENGYEMKEEISEDTVSSMLLSMSRREKEEFRNDLVRWRNGGICEEEYSA